MRVAYTALLCDTSGSMAEEMEGFEGRMVPKIEALKEAIEVLLLYKREKHPLDKVGCVTFNTRARVLFLLSDPANPSLISKIRSLTPEGKTNLSEALELGIDLLSKTPKGFLKVMYLFSDGCPNIRTRQVLPLARMAKRLRINIHSIGIGDGLSSFDEELLKKIARATHNGRYQHCRTLGELLWALRSIR